MESHFINQSKPSWQSRLFNLISRFLFKPLMRLASVKLMRSMTAFMARFSVRKIPRDITIKPFKGSHFEGEWITPESCQSAKIILYFPGGGFVVRTPAAHRDLVIRLCRKAKTRGLLVFYRLAPEDKFPAGLDDCVEAYKNLIGLGYDPNNIVLAGDSAGGNMVLSTLLYLRDHQFPLPAAGIMLSPLLDLTFTGESRQTNARLDPMLPNGGKAQIQQMYHPDVADNHPYVSPVLADFTGLPPILGQVGSTEILRDDTVRAAVQAEAAGVPFSLEVWQGMPHVWQLMDFIPESREAIAHIASFVENPHANTAKIK